MSAITARGIVTDVLGPAMTRSIWSGNYAKALPLSVLISIFRSAARGFLHVPLWTSAQRPFYRCLWRWR